MKIHKVKAPFWCRPSQFRDGERDLCIGIKIDVLRTKPVHRVQVGTKVFDVDTKKALDLAIDKNSFFKGNTVAVVPYMLVSTEVVSESPVEPVESVLQPDTPKVPSNGQLFATDRIRRPRRYDGA